jgi:hypothetical protein
MVDISVIPFGLGVDQHRVYDRGDTLVHHVDAQRKEGGCDLPKVGCCVWRLVAGRGFDNFSRQGARASCSVPRPDPLGGSCALLHALSAVPSFLRFTSITVYPPSAMPDSASFATFVKQQREKKKNEELAQEFLGRGRKANTPGAGAGGKARNMSEKPTLLSRISGSAGVQKRSFSAKPAGSIDSKWQHDLHKLNNPNGPTARARGPGPNRTASASQVDRDSRTYDKFASVLSRNANPPARNNDAPGFNIRGVATGGPYTVIASNFAPGTTAADIEAVMSPHAGETLGCRLLTAAPTVMVELQVVTKEGADNVIATFNNQKVRQN